jgi:hypothetical protein
LTIGVTAIIRFNKILQAEIGKSPHLSTSKLRSGQPLNEEVSTKIIIFGL